jgi:hypothetical protein
MYHERALGLCKSNQAAGAPRGTGDGVPARLASWATLIPLARAAAGTTPISTAARCGALGAESRVLNGHSADELTEYLGSGDGPITGALASWT